MNGLCGTNQQWMLNMFGKKKRQNKICYYEYTLLAKYIVSTKVQHGQSTRRKN